MELLDTDVLIDIQRGHPNAVAWYGGLPDWPTIPGFVLMELIQDANNAAEVSQSRQLVTPLTLVWPTQVDCQRALADFAQYHLSHGLGLIGGRIAATAVGLSATLRTLNVKHFRIVPQLIIRQPYSR